MRTPVLLAPLFIMPGMAIAGPPAQCVTPAAQLQPAQSATSKAAPSVSDIRMGVSTPAVAEAGHGFEPPIGLPPLSAVIPPPEIDQIPALKHIADTGAQLIDLGTSHGLRMVLGRHGDHFMFLEVAPDGDAVVAGLQSDLSVAQLAMAAGAQVTELGTVHGLRGLFVRNGEQFQVLYATPDSERLIPGVMWDSAGKNVTRDQVTPIAGTIPTVVIDKDETASAPPVAAPAAIASLINTVEQTSFGAYGAPDARKLWMFIDPQCPFSIRAMQQLQPLVDQKKIQLAIIPLAVIDYENQGQSTKSALAMLSKPTTEMVNAWRKGDLKGPADAAAEFKLRTNMAAAEAIRVRGTPSFVWRGADGKEDRADGLPSDLNALVASIGTE